MAEGGRHVNFSSEEIEEKIRNTVPKNTRKSNKAADNVLKNYLREKGYSNVDYVHYPKQNFNDILKNFWFEVRQKKRNKDTNAPEMYSKATLQNIRHAINRNLQDNGKNYDITTDPEFTESEKAYKSACKELKKFGKAVTKSYPEINHKG